MGFSSAFVTILFVFLHVFFQPVHVHAGEADLENADSNELVSDYDSLDWAASTVSAYPFGTMEEEDEGAEVGMNSNESSRRSLLWRMHYFISYGALSANRVPCPPRSGRSYYTHNCYRARGPAHPYHRSCSAIARCRR